MQPTDNDNSDDTKNLKQRKEKVIQPLQNTKSSSPISTDGVNDDLLAELRAKTAALAEKIQGHDEPKKTILQVDTEPLDDEEIVKALKESSPVETHNQPKETLQKGANPAVGLIRDKLARLYGNEPDAAVEAIESYQAGTHKSAHQQFMYTLTTSGKSLADIQTEWHNYYVGLPDDQKHQVWKEFYDTQGQISQFSREIKKTASPKIPNAVPKLHEKQQISNRPKHQMLEKPFTDNRAHQDIKSQLLDKVNAGGKLTVAHHAKSLLFGLSLAALVGGIFTFTFFNEVFIAPFISPSRNVSATPIIGSQTGAVGTEPRIIIPKINLEVPVVYGLADIEEATIQKELENGVVHYASTPNPGQQGNVVIVGHSSNNILNSGKYKFAFVLLKRLETDDTFFLEKDGIRYTYKVFRKEVVTPDNVSVLNTQEKPNTITLITCDPPGTSINRLIVVAEQISPDPTANTASTAIPVETTASKLPSNAPSLWSRIWPF